VRGNCCRALFACAKEAGMTIVRVQKIDRYSVISNVPLTDRTLSWQARGLLAYLLSKPTGWNVVIGDLVNQGTAGKDAIYAMIRELGEHGYIKKDQSRGEDGTMQPVSYTVYEDPSQVAALPRPIESVKKEKETQPGESTVFPTVLSLFVSSYPAHRRRFSDEAILHAWKVATTRTSAKEIAEGLEKHKASWKWQNEPDYIPGIVKFLAEERWKDPVSPPPPKRREDMNAGGRGELVF
jgi:hypothetical protein